MLVGYAIDYMYDYSLPCIVELLIMRCTTGVLHMCLVCCE